jgi:YHS domain-containing protein
MKKMTRFLLLPACALGVAALTTTLLASDTPQVTSSPSCCSDLGVTTTIGDASTNVVPDLLKTCPVSGDKLDGDMGAPFIFVYKGQQVKLCCKSCKKDFDANPEKYMKLIRAADKK